MRMQDPHAGATGFGRNEPSSICTRSRHSQKPKVQKRIRRRVAIRSRIWNNARAIPLCRRDGLSGCYIGIEGGGNWGRTRNHDITAPFVGVPVTNPFDLSGGLAGGTIGCNYQIAKWVIGIEDDFSWTNKDGV